jgi:hypothetical protein
MATPLFLEQPAGDSLNPSSEVVSIRNKYGFEFGAAGHRGGSLD